MSEIDTHLALEGGDLVVRRYQDAEDIADRAKMLREQPNRGDFHHKWSIPNGLVETFYQEYCGNTPGNTSLIVKPMNDEFWTWVHKKMKDPQYKVFWCHDAQNQFRVGYTRNDPLDQTMAETMKTFEPALKGLADAGK